MRSRTHLDSVNRKSPREYSEAEETPERRSPGLSPRGSLTEGERSEVPEALPTRIPSAGGALPPGGADGPKVPRASPALTAVTPPRPGLTLA